MNRPLFLNRIGRIAIPFSLLFLTMLLFQPVRGESTAVDVVATMSDELGNDVDADNSVDMGDTISYTVVIANNGADDATGVVFSDTLDANTTFVPGSLAATPLAADDTYMSVGNTLLQVCGTQTETTAVFATNVLSANDSEFAGDNFTITAVDSTSANGGIITDDNNGCFRYLPPVNFTGNDTFDYTITSDNDGSTATGTATIMVSDIVWYVDSNGANGDGRSSSPFNTIAGAQAASSANHIIYLFEGDYDAIVLKNGQSLIGEGVALNVGGKAIRVAGNRPNITSAVNGILIQVATDNTIRGLNIGDSLAGGGGVVSLGTNDMGTLTVDAVAIGGTGRAVILQGNGTLAITLDSITSSADGNGINIDANGGALNGTFTVTGATNIDDMTNVGISINGTSASFTFNATSITNAPTTALSLSNNVGATFSFASLNASSSNAGLSVSNSGTLTISGAGNTVSAANAPAVEITNTTIGAAGVTFQSVTANGGANGITLNNTGSGAFTVTGTGTTDGSGGTIQNTNARGIELIDAQNVSLSNMTLTNASTANGATTNDPTCTTIANGGTNTGCNAALHMQDVTTIALTNVDITGSEQHGMNGNNVTGLTMTNSNVLDSGNVANEHGVHIINLLGTSTLTNVDFSQNCTNNFLIENSSDTATIGITNSNFDNAHTFANNGTPVTGLGDACMSTGNEKGVFVQASNSANVTLNVTNSDFTNNALHGLHVVGGNSSVINLTATGNTLNGDRGLNTTQTAILFVMNDSTMGTFNLNSNTLGKFGGSGIRVFARTRAQLTGQINGNMIDDTKRGNGIEIQAQAGATSADNPSIIAEVNNNTINLDPDTNTQAGLAGIHLEVDDIAGGNQGASSIDVSLDGNNVTTDGHDAAIEVYLEDNNTQNNRTCVNLTNNDPVDGDNGTFGATDFFYGNDPNSGTGHGTAIWQGWTGDALTTWNNAGNNAIDDEVFTLGTIQDGTCATIPTPRTVERVKVSAAQTDVLQEPTTTSAETASTAIPAAPTAGETVSLTIGTLPAGKSISVTFAVTVNTPLPNGVLTVSNQGTLTGDNFADVLTDDPDTGTASDATVTALAQPEIAVIGNGVVIGDGDTSPDSADHTDFGTLVIGESVTRTFTISNSGDADLQLTGTPLITVTGSSAFSVVQQPTTPVSQLTSTTFQIRYAAVSRAVENATVQIATNDANETIYDFVIGAEKCQDHVTVQNDGDFGAGTLRQAVDDLCPAGGLIDFAAGLSGGTIIIAEPIGLETPATTIQGNVPITISGGGTSQIFDVFASAEISLTHLTITNGGPSAAFHGGAIDSNGTLLIESSTLHGNTSQNTGGAIRVNMGTTTLRNSTISGNTAATTGGGVQVSGGMLIVINSTFIDNLQGGAGGANIDNNGTLHLTNSLLASMGGSADCASSNALATNINNLVEDGSCAATFSGSPNVGALTDNGGQTQTHALLFNSPAVDLADNANCPTIDQRGQSRSDDHGCDIGAFEMKYSDSDNVFRDDLLNGQPRGFGPTLVQITTTSGTVPSSHVTKTIAPPPGLVGKPIEVFWDVTTNATTYSVDVKFCYTDAELAASTAVTNEGALVLYRSESGNAPWLVVAGSTVDTVANCVSAIGVTEFSKWAIAEVGATDVTLQSVDVTQTTNGVTLIVMLLTILAMTLATSWHFRRRHMMLVETENAG